MTARAVPPNQQQVGIGEDERIDSIDSFFGDGAIRRDEHFILPALDGDTEDPQNVGPEIRLNNRDEGHLVPGLVEVDPAAGNRDEGHLVRGLVEVDPVAGNVDEDAANELLQQMEQKDLQAVRNVLGRPTQNSVITASHCWLVLKNLREILPEGGPHKIPHAQDYGRILERLARVMSIPSEQDYESAHCNQPLGYERHFKLLEEMTPDFSGPLDYGECLDRLCEDMTLTSSMMRFVDGVYVSKDREQYARHLRSLATRVLRGV